MIVKKRLTLSTNIHTYNLLLSTHVHIGANYIAIIMKVICDSTT